MKLLLFLTLIITKCASAPGGSGLNLNGKMFTLSGDGGGLRIYLPTPSSWSSPTPYLTTDPDQTTPYRTTATPYRTTAIIHNPTTTTATTTTATTTATTTTPWTTPPTTRGVTVCLRYVSDPGRFSGFTLSPSSSSLRLDSNGVSFTLRFNGYNSISLQPSIRLWSDLRQNMWTSICVTVDTVKKVAQIFRDSDMSPRKLLPYWYTWSGEPVVEFSGFEGQVTDVQVWDYPLRYKEVLYYMSAGFYGPYQGSVLNWSNISFSIRGNTLLEETYEEQMKLPAGSGKPRHRPRWEKSPRKVFNSRKSKETRRQLI